MFYKLNISLYTTKPAKKLQNWNITKAGQPKGNNMSVYLFDVCINVWKINFYLSIFSFLYIHLGRGEDRLLKCRKSHVNLKVKRVQYWNFVVNDDNWLYDVLINISDFYLRKKIKFLMPNDGFDIAFNICINVQYKLCTSFDVR